MIHLWQRSFWPCFLKRLWNCHPSLVILHPLTGLLYVLTASTFGKDYGVLMTDGPLCGLLARAVVILNPEGKVIYTQLVPEIVKEPDYDAALAALK